MEKIIILDFCTGKVHVFNYDTKLYSDGEDFLVAHHDEYGFNESQCQWMISEELNLEIH